VASARIHAVLLDAVGTFIRPQPKPATTYGDYARRHGVDLDVDLVNERFHAAFRAAEALAGPSRRATDENRERERWRGIVGQVLPEVVNQAALFEELWEHYAQPSAWAVYDDVPTCIAWLRARGIRWGLASNCDSRLRRVVAGLALPAPPDFLFISAEIGWRKPARAFYDAVLARVGCAASEALMIGDDLANDVCGAGDAGLRALLLQRHGAAAGAGSIASLAQLPAVLERGVAP
jgi:putative hydrolase of the HAD superfamily